MSPNLKPRDGKPTAQEHTDLRNFLKSRGASDADVTAAIGLSAGNNRRETVEGLRVWLRELLKAE